MAKRYTDEFRRDAVRIATTSGLTRPQLSSDLGVLDLSRYYAAPLIAFTTTKELNYETDQNGRIP